MKALRPKGGKFNPWNWHSGDQVKWINSDLDGGYVSVAMNGWFEHFEDDGQTEEEFRDGFKLLLAKWTMEK